MNKGLATTIISDAGLIISSYFMGQTISTNLYIQLGIVGLAAVFAYLDIKYPQQMALFKEYLAYTNQAKAMSEEPDEKEDSEEPLQ